MEGSKMKSARIMKERQVGVGRRRQFLCSRKFFREKAVLYGGFHLFCGTGVGLRKNYIYIFFLSPGDHVLDRPFSFPRRERNRDFYVLCFVCTSTRVLRTYVMLVGWVCFPP